MRYENHSQSQSFTKKFHKRLKGEKNMKEFEMNKIRDKWTVILETQFLE